MPDSFRSILSFDRGLQITRGNNTGNCKTVASKKTAQLTFSFPLFKKQLISLLHLGIPGSKRSPCLHLSLESELAPKLQYPFFFFFLNWTPELGNPHRCHFHAKCGGEQKLRRERESGRGGKQKRAGNLFPLNNEGWGVRFFFFFFC